MTAGCHGIACSCCIRKQALKLINLTKFTIQTKLKNQFNFEVISLESYQLQPFMVPSSSIKVLNFQILEKAYEIPYIFDI
jgi:hypothetical protein